MVANELVNAPQPNHSSTIPRYATGAWTSTAVPNALGTVTAAAPAVTVCWPYMIEAKDNRVFLECLECMTGYWDVREPGGTFRTEDLAILRRLASGDEIGDGPRTDDV